MKNWLASLLLLLALPVFGLEPAHVIGSFMVAPGSTIQGVCGTTLVVNITLSGVEQQGTIQTSKQLYQGLLTNSTTTLYTAPAGVTTFLSDGALVNTSGLSVSGCKLFIGGSAAGNQILQSSVIPANGQIKYNGTGWDTTDGNGAHQTASSGGTTYTASSGLKAVGNDFRIDNPLATVYGGLGADLSGAGSGKYPKANGSGLFAASTLAAAGTGTCTNQFARALNGDAAPTCATVALGTDVSGTLLAAQFPALTDDVTTSGGSLATSLVGTAHVESIIRANRLDQFAAPNTDVAWASHKITGLLDPTSAQDAATKNYVDSVAAALNPAVAVQAATTSASDTSGFTYSNGASGAGATFTGTVNTAVTVDGFTFTALGQRLLIKNDTHSPIVPTFTAFNTATASQFLDVTYKSAATTTTSTFQDAQLEVFYQ